MTNSEITWDYGSTGRFVSAESFVKVWQTSDSIVDLQHKLAKDCEQRGWFQHDVKNKKENLTKATLRLNAVKQKDLASPYLNARDIAALNGTGYVKYCHSRWMSGVSQPEMIDLKEHIEWLEREVSRTAYAVEEAQYIADNPENLNKCTGSWQRVPGERTLQSRAARYRNKGVCLKTLSHNGKSSARDRWEVLAELAGELAEKNK